MPKRREKVSEKGRQFLLELLAAYDPALDRDYDQTDPFDAKEQWWGGGEEEPDLVELDLEEDEQAAQLTEDGSADE